MEITKLEYQKRNPNRVNVYVDEQFLIGISVNSLTTFSLRVGVELSDEMLDRIVLHDLIERLYMRSVAYLARGQRSKRQIYTYLSNILYKKKGDWYSEQLEVYKELVINEVTERLEENKLLDDVKFAHDYANVLVDRKPISKYLLKMKLLEKGIENEIAEEAVESAIPDDMEEARRTLHKKFGVESIKKEDTKKITFLQRKGFKWDTIRGLIEE